MDSLKYLKNLTKLHKLFTKRIEKSLKRLKIHCKNLAYKIPGKIKNKTKF